MSHIIRVIACAALLVPMAANGLAESVVVRAGTPLTGAGAGPADTRFTGFLHSLTPTLPSPDRFEALKPSTFRTGALTNIAAGVVTGNFDTYHRTIAAGAKFEYVLSDYVYVKPASQISWPGTSLGGDPFSRWKADVDNRIAAAQAAGATSGRWDLWNEPDWPTFWPFQSDAAGRDQFFQAWKIAYAKVPIGLPNVKIVGPSMALLNGASGQNNTYPNTGKFIHLASFLNYAKSNNVMPDVLGVHVFEKDILDQRLSEVRALLTSNGVPHLPIAVNEYVAPHEQTRPGVLPHYFARMLNAGVQYAVHATWPEPNFNSSTTNSYNDSLDGLLTYDTKLPRSTWWVYNRYAEMTGNYVQVDAGATVSGLASVDGTNKVATILLGRDFDDQGYLSTLPSQVPESLNVRINDILVGLGVSNGMSLNIELQHIVDSGFSASSGPISTTQSTIYTGGPINVSLNDFGWSDAYFIKVMVLQPGDFNADGRVDAADYTRWRKTTSVGSFHIWRQNFGKTPGGNGLAVSVPEPVGSRVLLIGLIVCGFYRSASLKRNVSQWSLSRN